MREDGPEPDTTPPMPPVVIPPDAELRLAAERSPVLKELRQYVAGLAGHSGHGDSLVGRWAEDCGLVRVLKGAHVPVKKNAKLLRDPLALWERAFSTVGAAGQDLAGKDSVDPGIQFPQLASALTFTLYRSNGVPVPAELALGFLAGMFERSPAASPSLRYATTVLLELLDRLGAVERDTVTDPASLAKLAEIAGSPDPDPTLIRLTPLAVWATNRELREAGVAAPIVGEAADQSLDDLSSHLLDATPKAIDADLKAWVRRRSPLDAATEAGELLRTATTPSKRLFALIALGETGESGLVIAAEIRAEGGLPGAVAGMWLSERGAVDRESVTRDEVVIGMTDHYAAMNELGAFVHQLAEMDDGFDLVELLTVSGHPATTELLDVVAAGHPDRATAKKARKARFKLRSRGL
ncbi:hypothetical protein AVL48_08725 [Amycolatopsis regifaucium]|uniref:Uncharacterized protein n=2 Tax=Amycolatopsis regifaucium TaxID=546365 RepID=A0A154MDC5_9PSEU|nr:hypothetical protein AVL48_08725 [Amycolatopsis regifaucium]OKA05901.1 hypothetical protein ATP06_0222265 [Amycolatopsis regifaucium]